MLGASAGRDVVLGFASSRTLHASSYADVLDERSGRGYQRRLNARHSLDFRRYIRQPGSSTIPLTFNLRPSDGDAWRLDRRDDGLVDIRLADRTPALSRVDCQHRLGFLSDIDVVLPFMCFVGLTVREEMEIFGVINGKAKGLSPSLLDFHDAQLCDDLAAERPELLVALHLKNEPTSPWYNRLDLGGVAVSGLERKASLRTVQKASKLFLRRVHPRHRTSVESAARAAHDFWVAFAALVPHAFLDARRHLVTKGVGVYALMELAADIVAENGPGAEMGVEGFTAALADFVPGFDWSSSGPLRGLGGEGGVPAAVGILRETRFRSRLRLAHG